MKVVKLKQETNQDALECLEVAIKRVKAGEVRALSIPG
jgi:hypothetical protein